MLKYQQGGKFIMPNVNILCCFEDKPIFLYNPVGAVSYQFIIINYVNKIKTKWAERQTFQVGEASFLYVEIQIYLAKKRILNHTIPKRKLDKWCLSFLEMIINEKKV